MESSAPMLFPFPNGKNDLYVLTVTGILIADPG
jgi:hypothetical protein